MTKWEEREKEGDISHKRARLLSSQADVLELLRLLVEKVVQELLVLPGAITETETLRRELAVVRLRIGQRVEGRVLHV